MKPAKISVVFAIPFTVFVFVSGCGERCTESSCPASAPLCDSMSGQCVECLESLDCDRPDAPWCLRGECIGCVDTCAGATPVCDVDTAECVGCLNDSDCPGGTCVNYACVDNPCPAPCTGATPVCDAAAGRCVECLADAACGPTERCVSGSCVSACGTTCAAPTPLCNASTGRCVECLTNSDCDDSITCTIDLCGSGVCSSNPPDADGDGAGDRACGGTDCNDANRMINPSATEICDGVNNDCDSLTDDGCPSAITLGSPTNDTAYGGTGGSGFDDTCPAGYVVVGLVGNTGYDLFNQYVSYVAAQCAPASLHASTTTPYTYDVVLGAVVGLAGHGGTGTSWSLPCSGEGEMAIGIHGGWSRMLDKLGLICGTAAIEQVAGVWRVTISESSRTGYGGGPGGALFSEPCPTGNVATGDFGRSGGLIDQFGLKCSRMSLAIR